MGVVSELKVHKNARTSFIKWQTDVFIFLSLSSPKKRRNKKLGSWSIRREHFWRKTFLKAEAKHLDNLVRDINPFLQNRWVEEILPWYKENQLKDISFHSSNYWHYLQFLDAPVPIAEIVFTEWMTKLLIFLSGITFSINYFSPRTLDPRSDLIKIRSLSVMMIVSYM